LNGAIGP